MDPMFFFSFRLNFIKNFYVTSSGPFLKIKNDIEQEVPPYEPPYSEDGEPPFQEEWSQANASLIVLGGSCVSMLEGSLHMLLDTLMKMHGNLNDWRAVKSKDGWWGKHQGYFKEHGIDFATSGCNMDLLSEIILARNRVQHGEGLTTQSITYQPEDLAKVSSPFFVDSTEVDVLKELGEPDFSLFQPVITVDLEKLTAALEEVRKFGHWFTQQLGYAERSW